MTEEATPSWHRWIAPGIGVVLVAGIAVLLWLRLSRGADLEANHRAFLDAYVSKLRDGQPVEPSADIDASLTYLARATSWRVQHVALGIGTDGRGDSCWTLETVSPSGERVGIVIGVSDTEAPIRISGWGLASRCACPTRTASGSLRC